MRYHLNLAIATRQHDQRTVKKPLADRDLLWGIKQNPHIMSFVGTTENAVMIQIWTALITILILKALKAMVGYKWHFSNLVAFIRLNIFVKIDLQQWLDKPLITAMSSQTMKK